MLSQATLTLAHPDSWSTRNYHALPKALCRPASPRPPTPSSATFSRWLSKDDVESFAKPSQDTVTAVNEWLSSNGVGTPGLKSAAGDWVHIQVPVSKAEEMLDANFATFEHTETGYTTVRSLEHSLPQDLKSHINLIHPITS